MQGVIQHLMEALNCLLAELMKEDQDCERAVQLRKRMIELLEFIETYQRGGEL